MIEGGFALWMGMRLYLDDAVRIKPFAVDAQATIAELGIDQPNVRLDHRELWRFEVELPNISVDLFRSARASGDELVDLSLDTGQKEDGPHPQSDSEVESRVKRHVSRHRTVFVASRDRPQQRRMAARC